MKKFLIKSVIAILLSLILAFLIIVGLSYYRYKSAIDKLAVVEVKEYLKDTTENYVELDYISDNFKKAIVSVEDERFYERYGVDFIAFGRIIVNNMSLQSLQGGSTITEQLAKNVYFNYEIDIIRKIADIFILYDLENIYSKDEILEMYCNIIYYGDGCYGIYDASMFYFGKQPSELDLFESSLLAGVINAPSVYQLSDGMDLALKRQVHVLDRMLVNNVIDETLYNSLINRQNIFKATYKIK